MVRTSPAKSVLALLFLAAGTTGYVLVAKHFSGNKINLQAGWNAITYKGKEQSAIEAFASIIDYLVIAYYWDGETWHQVSGETMMVQGGEYNINVSRACTWEF